MTLRYALNYDWSKIGPVPWDERVVVTLQVDLWSYGAQAELREAVEGWRGGFEASDQEGSSLVYEGGCQFPPIVVNEGRMTLWIVSQGEDAFDSISYYAGQLFDVATHVDPEVSIVWTELPHHRRGERQWPIATDLG